MERAAVDDRARVLDAGVDVHDRFEALHAGRGEDVASRRGAELAHGVVAPAVERAVGGHGAGVGLAAADLGHGFELDRRRH